MNIQKPANPLKVIKFALMFYIIEGIINIIEGLVYMISSGSICINISLWYEKWLLDR